jgi:hypothetical protein
VENVAQLKAGKKYWKKERHQNQYATPIPAKVHLGSVKISLSNHAATFWQLALSINPSAGPSISF